MMKPELKILPNQASGDNPMKLFFSYSTLKFIPNNLVYFQYCVLEKIRFSNNEEVFSQL
jgi:hypothetical protein